MGKTVIACDIDEVLSPLHDLVFAHHNAVYETNYPARDSSGKYYIDQFTGDSNEVSREKFKEFIESQEFRSVRPLDGAVAAITKLAQSYDLVIITSRQDFYEAFTYEWLEKHFPAMFKSVRFTEYVTGKGVQVPKLEICKQLGASYLIDDNLEHVLDGAAAGAKSVLFGDYPWNKADSLPDNVTRCADWPAVLEYFDGRS